MSLDFVKILELPEQRTATTVTLVLLLRKRRLGAMCQNGAYNFCCAFVVVVCVWKIAKKNDQQVTIALELQTWNAIEQSNGAASQPRWMIGGGKDGRMAGWWLSDKHMYRTVRHQLTRFASSSWSSALKVTTSTFFCISSTKCPSMKQNKKNMEWPP